MKILYLIGYPVSHSLSALMQNAAYRSLGLHLDYHLLSVPPEELNTAVKKLRDPCVLGGNVTIPHKVKILDYIDELDDSAKVVGAVNTIYNQNGVLKGYNTDGPAAIRALKEVYGDLKDAKVVMIGSGGAARAVGYCLSSLVRHITILARDEFKGRYLARSLQNEHSLVSVGVLDESYEQIEEADILINATPVGMFPKVDESPIPKSKLHRNLLVFDLVYNPRPTKLLYEAKETGCRTLDGLKMLVYQGCEAFKIWTGVDPPEQVMKEAAEKGLEAVDR